ncbi:DUF6333 family protein [Streptomyces sp. S186]|uniref:DUF6333 family protein n=1 Tax=Streptomyces sp. S186 TaxID=3434395 RepID=UPI003F66BB88
MSDHDYWTIGPETMVRGGGDYSLTLVTQPFTVSARTLPANDPDAARRFAEAFPTVEEVLEVLPPVPANEGLYLNTRSDLDLVRVGVWGNVTGISDPALADDGTGRHLLEETAALSRRYPDARIVGRVDVDCGESHTEDIVRLPCGTMLYACGWPAMEPWEVVGEPDALLAALDLTPPVPEAHGVEWADDPGQMDWSGLCGLALGEADPWPWPLQTSVFRVRHTEDYTGSMEDLWFLDG